MLAGDVLYERARLTPDKLALVCIPTGARFTYAALNVRASQCAAHWRELGIRKGDRVAILSENRVEYIDAFFAAGRSGVILVPLNTRLTAHELEPILRDSGARAVMYSAKYETVVTELRERVAIPHWIAIEDHLASSSNFGRLECSPEDIYCLLYTSGTTGKPKGVMLPHRMIAWNGYNTAVSWQLAENDISQVFTPMYHAGGLAVALVPMFVIGGTIILHEAFDAAEVLRTIEAERCTFVFGVPTIFKMLMEAPEFAKADLSSVRWFISGGAPLPQYILECYQKRGAIFKQGYGLTEAGVNCFAMTTEDSVRKRGSIGKPMMFTEVKLMRDGRPVPQGEVGEMWIRGPHVAKGYWNQPETTASTFDADGWLHTGHLAMTDGDSFFYIAGRSKDMLISGGVNVYPAEIEAELLQHAEVEDAAVVGVFDEKWGELPVAFVVPRKRGLTSSDLHAFLSARIAKYKIPREFIFAESLPRTAYGKVVKPELKAMYARAQTAG